MVSLGLLWQHAVRIFTPAMSNTESGRLKEEKGGKRGRRELRLPIETCETERDRVIILIYRRSYYRMS